MVVVVRMKIFIFLKKSSSLSTESTETAETMNFLGAVSAYHQLIYICQTS